MRNAQGGRDARGRGAAQCLRGVLVGALGTHEAGLADKRLGGRDLDGEAFGGEGAEPAPTREARQQAGGDGHEERGHEVRGGEQLLRRRARRGVGARRRIPGDLRGPADRVDCQRGISSLGDRAVAQAQGVGDQSAESARVGALGVRVVPAVVGEAQIPSVGRAGQYVVRGLQMLGTACNVGRATGGEPRLAAVCATGSQALKVDGV